MNSLTSTDWGLFSRLFLLELDEPTRDLLRADPRFSGFVPDDLQAARVEFTRLYSQSVYPYASVFLDGVPELNGESTARAQAFYDSIGFEMRPEWMAGAPDALGVELACEAWLLENGRHGEAKEFLREYLLPWGPVCCLALERTAQLGLYSSLARAERELLLETGEALAETIVPEPREPEAEPEARDLYWVSDFLSTPSRCGLFLAKDDLRRIAEGLDLPISFGDRSLMLSSLLRGAGMRDCVPPTLQALKSIYDDAAFTYTAWKQAYPHSSALWNEWARRSESTRKLLDEMSETASQWAEEKPESSA